MYVSKKMGTIFIFNLYLLGSLNEFTLKLCFLPDYKKGCKTCLYMPHEASETSSRKVKIIN